MKRIVVPAALFLIGLPLAASAFKEGPYPNVTGGFGEQSCHLCHLDNPINAPGGSLTLEGIPPSFAAGQTYRITVTISRQGLRRGGFEIAARFASGKQKGKQAGAWKPLDTRVQLIPGAVDNVLTFVQHNLTGSRVPATGVNAWTIDWTAPQAPAAPVQFNVAANASNNDDSPLGDYIYLTMVRSTPAPHLASR
ncbi:MAG TPA: choice-of-anchor V domain-containing protein [Vicinamibacterales bacterium]|nr:choice-of-anchor V domain-containing protein [Vicinamibacterales bacterium]